jgi:hypothetical protein
MKATPMQAEHLASTGMSASHLVTRRMGFFICAVSFLGPTVRITVHLPLAANEWQTALQFCGKIAAPGGDMRRLAGFFPKPSIQLVGRSGYESPLATTRIPFDAQRE